MSKPPEDQPTQSVELLYKKRKARFSSPKDVQQKMLHALHNKHTDTKPWWHINMVPYIKVSAITVALAVTFMVINLQMINVKNTNIHDIDSTTAHANMLSNIDYHSVQLHILDNSDSSTILNNNIEQLKNASTEIQIKYQQAAQGFLAKQTKVQIHQQRYALVKQNTIGLTLVTCENELLELSQGVVDLLFRSSENQKIDMSKGQFVAIAFDKNGHIVQLHKATSKLQC